MWINGLMQMPVYQFILSPTVSCPRDRGGGSFPSVKCSPLSILSPWTLYHWVNCHHHYTLLVICLSVIILTLWYILNQNPNATSNNFLNNSKLTGCRKNTFKPWLDKCITVWFTVFSTCFGGNFSPGNCCCKWNYATIHQKQQIFTTKPRIVYPYFLLI